MSDTPEWVPEIKETLRRHGEQLVEIKTKVDATNGRVGELEKDRIRREAVEEYKDKSGEGTRWRIEVVLGVFGATFIGVSGLIVGIGHLAGAW